jgi:hypothetical protein
MTKPVRDYFARRMEDPVYAAAYQELKAEYQAKRARIRAGIKEESFLKTVSATTYYKRKFDISSFSCYNKLLISAGK